MLRHPVRLCLIKNLTLTRLTFPTFETYRLDRQSTSPKCDFSTRPSKAAALSAQTPMTESGIRSRVRGLDQRLIDLLLA